MAKGVERELLSEVGKCFADPNRFVRYVYPWGRKGLLDGETGPDTWQENVLSHVGEMVLKRPDEPVRIATASGHGVGKTALVSWLVQWFMSTRPHPQVIVTANTLPQLQGKTWREMAKWHKLMLNKDWFTWTATKFYHNQHPETWFSQAVPWSEEHPEAFAGTHEKDVLIVMDEASGIPDNIWEVVEGAMTTPGAMWVVFGNPTRNTGRFFECFNRFKHRWHTLQIDSRTCKKTDKKQLADWVEDYGDDSDFVRVRVKGVFPRGGDRQFIASDVVQRCLAYEAQGWEASPKLLGIDVARYGEDMSVICMRQGRKVHWFKKYREMDVASLSSRIVEIVLDETPDAIFIDAVGIGAGVVDRVRQLGVTCVEVNGGTTDCHPKYRNKRTEMWGELRTWMKSGAEIPDDKDLIADLVGPEYSFTNTQKLMLERKEDMKRRGLSSPDVGDALALTFAYPVGASFDTFAPEPEVYADGY